MGNKSVVFGIYLILMLTFVDFCFNAKEPKRDIISKKLICTDINYSYIYNLSCHIKLVNRTVQLLNFDGFGIKNTKLNWIHAKIVSYYKFNVIYRQMLFAFDEDVCGVLSGGEAKLFNPNILGDEQNISTGCPFDNHLYVKGLNIRTRAMADIIPVGDWRIDSYFYTRNKTVKEIYLFKVQIFIQSVYVGGDTVKLNLPTPKWNH